MSTIAANAIRTRTVPAGPSSSNRLNATAAPACTETIEPTVNATGNARGRRLTIRRVWGAAPSTRLKFHPAAGRLDKTLGSSHRVEPARTGRSIPRPPRGRALRGTEPLGRRIGKGFRRARLQGPGDHQLRLRLHPRPFRRGRDPR